MPSWWWLSSTCYIEEWKRQWRGYREGCEGYWAGYQGHTHVGCSDIARRSLIANYVFYSTLKTINEELDKIAAQGSWRLGIYSDLNMTAVDDCLNRLSTALEKFKVCPTANVHGLGRALDKVDMTLSTACRWFARRRKEISGEDPAVGHAALIGHCRSTNASETSGLPWAKCHYRRNHPVAYQGRNISRILGAGGMGKTSVALGIVEQPLIKARFLPENIVWVPCIEATSKNRRPLFRTIIYILGVCWCWGRFCIILDIDRRPCVNWSVPSGWRSPVTLWALVSTFDCLCVLSWEEASWGPGRCEGGMEAFWTT